MWIWSYSLLWHLMSFKWTDISELYVTVWLCFSQMPNWSWYGVWRCVKSPLVCSPTMDFQKRYRLLVFSLVLIPHCSLWSLPHDQLFYLTVLLRWTSYNSLHMLLRTSFNFTSAVHQTRRRRGPLRTSMKMMRKRRRTRLREKCCHGVRDYTGTPTQYQIKIANMF